MGAVREEDDEDIDGELRGYRVWGIDVVYYVLHHMPSVQPLIGHSRILDFFSRVIQNRKVSHAYCFAGPAHLGKRTAAESIVRELFHIDERPLGTHPDIAVVEQEKHEKTDKTKKDIGVEQMRKLVVFLSRKPFLGGRKAAIIDDAEKLNEESANVMLKTLEEPSGNTIIFLITSDISKLPATILSRCQTVFFQPVPAPLIEKGLMQLGVEPEQAAEWANECHGAPGTAIAWMRDADAYAAHKAERERFRSILGRSFADKIQVVEPFFADKDDHIAARDRLRDILWLWQCEARRCSFEAERANQWPLDKYAEVSRRIAEARRFLLQNVHPRLLVEEVLLALP